MALTYVEGLDLTISIIVGDHVETLEGFANLKKWYMSTLDRGPRIFFTKFLSFSKLVFWQQVPG